MQIVALASEMEDASGAVAILVAASSLALGMFNKAALQWTTPYTVLQLVSRAQNVCHTT